MAAPARRWRPSPLLIRVFSAAVLLLGLFVLVYIGTYGVWAAVVLVGGLALWEFRRLSDGLGFRAPSWLLYPLGAFFAFKGTLLKDVNVEIVLALALVAGSSVLLFLPGRRQGIGRWAMGMAGALYIGIPMNYYLLLYAAPHGRGLAWVLFTILAVVAGDGAALLVGMRLGRHLLAPEISPKKTVEGAAAGLVAAVLVMLIGAFGVLGLPAWEAVVLGLLAGVSGELGDLVESQMKRIAGMKDSSHLIPGHGGVLDRIDSLLFPPILVYAFAAYAGLLR